MTATPPAAREHTAVVAVAQPSAQGASSRGPVSAAASTASVTATADEGEAVAPLIPAIPDMLEGTDAAPTISTVQPRVSISATSPAAASRTNPVAVALRTRGTRTDGTGLFRTITTDDEQVFRSGGRQVS